MSLGTGLGKLAGKVFRIGHLGDFNDLDADGHARRGARWASRSPACRRRAAASPAAMAYLAECRARPARAAA